MGSPPPATPPGPGVVAVTPAVGATGRAVLTALRDDGWTVIAVDTHSGPVDGVRWRLADPATPQVHASIIGGDSFLELRVDRGTAVEVLGYRSEPFIRFLADGTVQENRTSASYFVSKARQGAALPADFVDDAPPAWHTVATDGRYAWHDHRVHWMTDSRPPGRHPGDVVLREQVPLLVDDVAVSIIVESVWMPAASRTPVWLGAIVGLAAGLLAGLGGRFGSLSRWRALPGLHIEAQFVPVANDSPRILHWQAVK